MAITVPTIGTEIDVVTFGKPVVDQLNALVPTAWTMATLLTGWTHQANESVEYRKVGDVVQIRGRCNNAGATGGFLSLFTLPVGFRPPKNLMIYMSQVQSFWKPGVGIIDTLGAVADSATNVPYTAAAFNIEFSIT